MLGDIHRTHPQLAPCPLQAQTAGVAGRALAHLGGENEVEVGDGGPGHRCQRYKNYIFSINLE